MLPSCAWYCILRWLCSMQHMRIKSPPVQECTDVTAGVEKLLSLLLKFQAVTVGNCVTKQGPVIIFSPSISGISDRMSCIPFLLCSAWFIFLQLFLILPCQKLQSAQLLFLPTKGGQEEIRYKVTIQFILIDMTFLWIFLKLVWIGKRVFMVGV